MSTVFAKSKKSKKINYERFGWYFVLPYIVSYCVFGLVPIGYTFFLAFSDASGFSQTINLVGFDNFIFLIKDSEFYMSLWRTVILWIISFVLNIVVAFLLALLFTDLKIKFKGVRFFRTVMFLPSLLMPSAIGVLFRSLFTYPVSPANQILSLFGAEAFDFPNNKVFMVGLTSFIMFWSYFGRLLTLIMAGLCSIDTTFYEAADVDGATRMQKFFKISLPLMGPVLVYIAVTSIIGGLQVFDTPFFISDGIGSPQGSLKTVSVMLYNYAFGGGRDYAYSATIAIGQFLIIAVLSVYVFKRTTAKEGKV